MSPDPRPEGVAISLVVCTRNRAEQLARCLETLEQLTSSFPWQLVVVDNGSTDDTWQLLRERPWCGSAELTTLAEPRPGLGSAKNAALPWCRGDIVAFTDDDCYPARDWLDALLKVFSDSAIGYAGGRVLLHDPDDHPITTQTSCEAREIAPGSFIEPGFIHGANLAVRRDVLLAGGGFDGRFGPGGFLRSAVDTELMCRLSAAGVGGRFDPRLVVYHHHGRRSTKDVDALEKRYALGRGAYFAKAASRRATRSMYARQWYWRLRARLKQRQWRVLAWEIEGAARFVISEIAGGAGRGGRARLIRTVAPLSTKP